MHVIGADHDWNQVVAEAAEQERHRQKNTITVPCMVIVALYWSGPSDPIRESKSPAMRAAI